MKLFKNVTNFDYILFFSIIALSVIGIFFIYSANLTKPPEIQTQYQKQIIFLIISIVLFFCILFIPLKTFKSLSLVFYAVTLLGLFLTLFFPEVKNQKRFAFNFSSFQIAIQFSEFMKISTIVLLSSFYANNKKNIKSIVVYAKGILIVIIPMFLILLQKDLGTFLVFIPILLGISFIAGVKKRYLLYSVLLLFCIASIPFINAFNEAFYNNENEFLLRINNILYGLIVLGSLSTTMLIACLGYFNIIKGISEKFKRIFYWYIFGCSVIVIGVLISYPVDRNILDDYQKDRIKIFLKPDISTRKSGYNIIQSQTTIGNGGFLGKGWCKGDQTQNKYLPEPATDFIYPVIAEERGFIGSFVILFLFSMIFYRGFDITLKTRQYFEAYVIVGILSMFLFHVMQNIGMSIGIMPITGIPLPFLSYGGSFLITCFIAVSIIVNIELSRYQY